MDPVFTAFVVRDYKKKGTDEDRASWREIGVGFMHEDGQGYDIVLDAVPVTGRIVLRTNTSLKQQRKAARE